MIILSAELIIMKKQFILIILHFLFFYELNAQKFEWAKQFEGTRNSYGASIKLDMYGNMYITGNFFGTADFNPGPGVFNLTSTPDKWDAFITKLDSSGNLIWAKQIGGSDHVYVHSIFVDLSGDVYTTGEFGETADFNPGTEKYNLTSPGGGTDCFILKLDAFGNFLWAKNIGGISEEVGYAVSVDASGNLCVFGTYCGQADFDPGIGNFYLGGCNNFILKLDSTGNFIWAKEIGVNKNGSAQNNVPVSIVNDASGNIYTTGFFNGTGDFDPGIDTFNFTSVGGNDIFISKLDATGNFVWAIQIAGSYYDDYGFSIKSDHKGYIYIVGSFTGTADFDPGPGVYNLKAKVGTDVFVLKLEESGNFVWAKNFGGTYSFGQGIALDALGNIYTTGRFESTGDFNPGSGTATLTSKGQADIFVSKLDPAGNFVWAKQMGGSEGNDSGLSIVIDSIGNVYTTGSFYKTADFDPGPATYNLTAEVPFTISDFEIFVHKMSQCVKAGIDVRTACDSLKWIDGKTYTSSNNSATHVFNNTKGCDSLVLLDLKINKSYFSSLTRTACDSFNWNGNTYQTSGNYLSHLKTSVGCDSTIALNLSILSSSDTSIHETACRRFGFNDQVYTTGGTYYQKLKNRQGCDSLIELDLNIVNLDTSITRLGNTLFAIDSTATYQWVDCDDHYATIVGATQKSFVPGKDGRYAVIISAPPCLDTTSCVSIVLTQTKSSDRSALFIYPNPTSSKIHLEIPDWFSGEKRVMIRDIHGRTVLEKLFTGNGRSDLNIDISSFSAGLYYLSLQSNSAMEMMTLLKI